MSFSTDSASSTASPRPAIIDELAQLPVLAYQRFVLPNGLVLIVHERPEVPQVAVHLFYGVGAKDEPPGLHGFAHLFEHLMFSGSDNLPGNYIAHLQGAGASELNAVTDADFTHYFQCVSQGALDFVLFAESDRMGCFANSLNQAAMDVQREVVINEMREAELQPLGKVPAMVLRGLFPADHPYAHSVFGSERDLRQATLADAKAWFARYYRPNNAVICLAGAITADEALAKVTHWFGDIAPGEPLQRTLACPVPCVGAQRLAQQFWGAPALLRMAWPLPRNGHPVTLGMQLLAELLTGHWRARLSWRLEHELQLASQVSAYVETGMLACYFNISVMLLPGQTHAHVERVVREVLAELAAEGPGWEELELCKRGHLTGALQASGSNHTVAHMLGYSELMYGYPGAHREVLERLLRLEAAELRAMLREWLGEDGLVLQVSPPALTWAPGSGPLRTTPPTIALSPPLRLPAMQQLRLGNGLDVTFVPRAGQALMSVSLLLAAAPLQEPMAQAGLAQLTFGLLGGGAGELDPGAFNEALRGIGATFELGTSVERMTLRLQFSRAVLEPGLALLAAAIQAPWLDEQAFEALRQESLEASVQRSGILVVMPALIFPAGHGYAKPLFREGSLASLQQLRVADAQAFHQAYYRPENARLLVVGDIDQDALEPMLQRHFGVWQTGVAGVADAYPQAGCASMGQVALADYPGMPLTTISVLFDVPAQGRDAVLTALYKLLGESFDSRINQRLREHRQLTYGVSGLMSELPGYRFMGFELTVAAGNVGAAVAEIVTELRSMLDTRPFTAVELEAARRSELLQLTMLGDSPASMAAILEHALCVEQGADHWRQAADKLQALELSELNHCVREYIRLDNSFWYIAGDLEGFENELNSLLGLPMRYLPSNQIELYAATQING